MVGRVLVYDDIAVNRIVLHCKLSAACYTVDRAETLADIPDLVAHDAPDLLVMDMDASPDGALSLCRRLRATPGSRGIPIVMLSASRDPVRRVHALAAGANEILSRPVQDELLFATLRKLLRQQAELADARARVAEMDTGAMAEPAQSFAAQATIALVSQDAVAASGQGTALAECTRHRIVPLSLAEALGPAGRDADARVITIKPGNARSGLRLLSELKSRGVQTEARNLVIVEPDASGQAGAAETAAMAIDLGADDVMPCGFSVGELKLRLDALVARKQALDALASSISRGLRLATRDPLTGLHNRHFAWPQLDRMIADAHASGDPLALMVLDIDRFKRINDTYGHIAGDHVLRDIARWLSGRFAGRNCLLSRIGGEEFLIALPSTPAPEACRIARDIRGSVRHHKITLPDHAGTTAVTFSIGVAVNEPAVSSRPSIEALIAQADAALYGAKGDGRDQVTLARSAA